MDQSMFFRIFNPFATRGLKVYVECMAWYELMKTFDKKGQKVFVEVFWWE